MKRLYGFGLLILVCLFLIGLRDVRAITYTCSDTDGGIDSFVTGTVTATGNATTYSFTDIRTDNCNTTTVLNEYYCPSPTSWYGVQTVTCQYGCSNGRCQTSSGSSGGSSPVFKKVTRSPVEGADGAFWTLFFMQLAVIALLFYVISKKLKK